jgi:hypothetical protein
MTAMWVVQSQGREFGPYPFEKIQEFVVEGRVAAETALRRADGGPWVRARDVAGLMPVPQPPPVAKASPPSLDHAVVPGSCWSKVIRCARVGAAAFTLAGIVIGGLLGVMEGTAIHSAVCLGILGLIVGSLGGAVIGVLLSPTALMSAERDAWRKRGTRWRAFWHSKSLPQRVVIAGLLSSFVAGLSAMSLGGVAGYDAGMNIPFWVTV